MRWIFILLPWVELFSLIRLGAEIGAFQTLLYVFVTLMLGLAILRWQGMEVITRMQEAQLGWEVPRQLLVDDLALGLAGLLLAIPGLLTDTLAILVVIPPLLRRLFGARSGNGRPPGADGGPRSTSSARTTIEGEYRHLDDE